MAITVYCRDANDWRMAQVFSKTQTKGLGFSTRFDTCLANVRAKPSARVHDPTLHSPSAAEHVGAQKNHKVLRFSRQCILKLHTIVTYIMYCFFLSFQHVYVAIYIIYLSIFLSIHLSIDLSIYQSIYLSIYLSLFLSLATCVYVRLCSLFVCLHTYAYTTTDIQSW